MAESSELQNLLGLNSLNYNSSAYRVYKMLWATFYCEQDANFFPKLKSKWLHFPSDLIFSLENINKHLAKQSILNAARSVLIVCHLWVKQWLVENAVDELLRHTIENHACDTLVSCAIKGWRVQNIFIILTWCTDFYLKVSAQLLLKKNLE